MPVIRPTNRGATAPDFHARLVDFLVRELFGERTPQSPVVFELPTGRDGEVDVIVIWEAWKAIPPPERDSIIREAYLKYNTDLSNAIHYIDPEKTSTESFGPRLSQIVIGETPDEAITQGLLPYLIRPGIEADGIDKHAMRQFMLELGAIEPSTGLTLRFPDKRSASEAHARLTAGMPEADWEIIEEADPSDD
jgi:hypothetical protein